MFRMMGKKIIAILRRKLFCLTGPMVRKSLQFYAQTFCLIGPLISTVLPVKSDSDILFCLQSYQGLVIERSLVY